MAMVAQTEQTNLNHTPAQGVKEDFDYQTDSISPSA